jgi:hypothetical protein
VRPLDAAGLTKAEIRALSRRAGLPTLDEPASACLSSRIPYFSEVTDAKLRMIEQGEAILRHQGFRVCRVRHHGDADPMARLEIGRDEMARALEPEVAEAIDRALGALGYRHVTLDLRGYRLGSLNDASARPSDPQSSWQLVVCSRSSRSRRIWPCCHRRSRIWTQSTSLGVRTSVAGGPPGCSVFTALGKISTAALARAGVARPDVRASRCGRAGHRRSSAAALRVLLRLGVTARAPRRVATLLVVCSPLVWFWRSPVSDLAVWPPLAALAASPRVSPRF